MVAMLAFGGTFAYFTASASNVTGSATTGKVVLNSNGSFVASLTNVMPTQKLTSGAITLSTADSTEATYVAIKYTITVTGSDSQPVADLSSVGLADVLSENWMESGTDNIYVYSTTTTEATTVNVGTTINITDEALTFNATDNWTQGQDKSDNKLMGATITIKFEARSIQSSGFEDAAAAVAELVTKF